MIIGSHYHRYYWRSSSPLEFVFKIAIERLLDLHEVSTPFSKARILPKVLHQSRAIISAALRLF